MSAMRSALRDVPAPFAATVALVLLLGAWLFAPTLELGLFADDYMLMAVIDGQFPAPRHALDLFNFVDGTREDAHALQRLGSIAWWSSPDLRVAFMRPLSSALFRLDRVLFGDALWAYHAHSIAAWALLVIAAGLLYLRMFPGWPVAALATAFFALDQSHHGPVFWVCNRGGLYAVLLSLLGVAAHLHHRTRASRGAAWLSALCLCGALLFGEWALPMFGYVLAFEVAFARDGLVARVRALLPASALVLAFLAVRAVLGYGARGSGVYVDPASDAAGFGVLLLHRIPVFVADMVFNLPAHLWDQGSPLRDRILALDLIPPQLWVKLPGWRFFHVAIGLLAIILCAVALRFLRRGLTDRERVTLRFLLLGAVLSLVPVAGSFPSTRLTLCATFGLAPAFALFLREIGRRLAGAHRLGAPRFVALFALGAAVLYLQAIAPLREDVQRTVDNFRTTTEWVLAAELDPQQVEHQRVYMLNSAEFTTTFFFAYTWAYHARPLPRSYVPISAAPYAQDVERIADDTLLLRTLGGPFFDSPAEVHYRVSTRAFQEGDSVRLDGVRIEIARLVAGKPQTLKLTFDTSLDDPSQVFLVATESGLARFAVPPVGHSRRLRRAANPSWSTLDRGRFEQRIAPLPNVVGFTPLPAFVKFDPS
jgi:hypothetical protein